jgi:hypothetical protein
MLDALFLTGGADVFNGSAAFAFPFAFVADGGLGLIGAGRRSSCAFFCGGAVLVSALDEAENDDDEGVGAAVVYRRRRRMLLYADAHGYSKWLGPARCRGALDETPRRVRTAVA